jgi:hypothetical protein
MKNPFCPVAILLLVLGCDCQNVFERYYDSLILTNQSPSDDTSQVISWNALAGFHKFSRPGWEELSLLFNCLLSEARKAPDSRYVIFYKNGV